MVRKDEYSRWIELTPFELGKCEEQAELKARERAKCRRKSDLILRHGHDFLGAVGEKVYSVISGLPCLSWGKFADGGMDFKDGADVKSRTTERGRDLLIAVNPTGVRWSSWYVLVEVELEPVVRGRILGWADGLDIKAACPEPVQLRCPTFIFPHELLLPWAPDVSQVHQEAR